MKTYTREEFEKKYGSNILPQIEKKKPGSFLSGVGSSIKQSFLKGKEQVQGTGEFEGSIAPVRGFQLAGTLATALPKAVMGGIAGATPEPVKEALTKTIAEPVGKGFASITDLISDSQALQNFVMNNPNIAKTIEETAKVTGALSETAGGLLATQSLGQTAMGGANLARTGINKVADATKQGVSMTRTGITKGGDFIKGARDVIKPIISEAKTLPGKARVNLAQSRATEATLSKLKPAGQNAARSGVELSDVKSLYKIPTKMKPQLKKLAKVVQDFSEGKKTTNPFEVVGKPMNQGLKLAKTQADTIGSKIGKVADTLPKVTTSQVAPKVFNNLKKINGLQGLTVDKKGILNFKNTTLATAGTKADRSAIQKIFTDAIKNGTGKQKHLLRQELFEILGGKKKGGLQITGTQEKAFEAVRKGLADTLDDLNPTYKTLSKEYAQTIAPINKLQKALKTAGFDDDLADMSAGLLARRITSTSASNPVIRQALRDLDKVLASKGKSYMSTESLQDFYNILDKYYDIAGQTGFQGQVSSGVSKAIGGKGGISKLIDIAEGQVTKVLGETDIVKQRALEAVLKDIFGN